MPSPPPQILPLRIIIEQPLPGVALALQHGKEGLDQPTSSSPTQVVFDFAVRLGAPQADGTPNFVGPYTQGPAAGRFVYVGVGRRAGDAKSALDGRMKVPLTGISQSQVNAVTGSSGKRLAVRVPGRNPKGGPTLATVKLPADAWTVVEENGMSKVAVHPYDPEWPRTFERIHALVWPAVQHAAMRLEHVGSTAVPGLRAKPVVDACIVVASPRDIPFVVKGLAKVGYAHRGDLGVPGREAFAPPKGLPKHHLYASPRESLSLKNQLALRDYLRAHPDAAREYGELKEALARRYPDDMNGYINGKTDFILDILAEVGFGADDLEAIRRVNQPR